MAGKKIHWPGGREGPPPDVPRCGFLGNAPECHGNGEFLVRDPYILQLLIIN